jgi:GWxTD domain-containing protein
MRHRAKRAGLAVGLLAVLLCAVLTPASQANPLGDAAGAQQNIKVDVSLYPKIDESDLPEGYREWLREEVTWIITDVERDIFLRLETNGQRDAFVKEFWQQRDPTPGTPRNEYFEMYSERWAYATEFFGRSTSTPGWRTDMGRMHLLLGAPTEITRLENDQVLQPTIIWRYMADPALGIPPYFYLVFYKRHNSGDYKLYSPLGDGPKELLNPAGEMAIVDRLSSGQRSYGYAPTGFSGYQDGEIAVIWEILREIDSDIANAAFSLFPSDTGMQYISPLRSEILIGQIGTIPDVIMPEPRWATRVLVGVTEAEVRFESLAVQATAVALLDRDGTPFIHFAAQTPGRGLNLVTYEDSYYFTFEVSGSLTDPDHRIIELAEAHVEGTLETEEQANRFRASPFLYVDRLAAVPGPRTLDLIMENNVSHEFGRAEFNFEVPRPFPDELTYSDPLLCVTIQQVPDYDPFGAHYPFQISEWVLMPSADGRFIRDSQIYVYHQFHLPESFAQPIVVSYALTSEAGVTELAQELTLERLHADELGIINQTTALDLEGLALGSYTLAVEIDEGAGFRQTFPVTIKAPDPPEIRTFVNVQEQPPAGDPEVSLTLARQYRTVGDLDAAIAAVGRALTSIPDDRAALELQADLLIETQRHDELLALLKPRLSEDPNNVPLLLRLAEASALFAEHYDAIRYYERARLVGKHDTPEILNPLAAEYFAEENMEKARELLELSLELSPDQPEIQRMLELTRQQQ